MATDPMSAVYLQPSGDVSGYAHCPKESRIHDCSEYSEYYNCVGYYEFEYVVVRLIMSLVLLCLVLSSRFTLNTHVIKMSPAFYSPGIKRAPNFRSLE